MTTKQNFDELKKMSLKLSSFLEYCEKNPEFMERIEIQDIINGIYKDLNPLLGEPIHYVPVGDGSPLENKKM